MQKDYLDLKLDFMFKQLFGQSSRKHITIAFLNDLLGRTGDERIQDVTFVNTEMVKDRKTGKSARLDLTVVTNAGEHMNVEIQVTNQYDMPERILFYWAKYYSSSIDSGEIYQKLQRTIFVSIVNYPLFQSETDEIHSTFRIREDKKYFLWSDHLEFHVINLDAFMVKWRKNRQQIKEQHQQELPWLMLLSAADYRKNKVNNEILTDLEGFALNIEEVRDALIQWETLSANKDNRVLFEARAKELRDLLSNLEGERRLGREEGIRAGIEKGLREGKLNEKKTIALKMIEEGLDFHMIAKVTGLTYEEIRTIQSI